MHNDVLSFQQDSFGRAWIGTYDGLYVYDIINDKHSRIESGLNFLELADQRITALEISNNQMWIGFYRGGFQVFDLKNETPVGPATEDFSELHVTDICSDDKDGIGIWIATYNHGVLRITPKKTYIYFDSIKLPEKGVTRVLCDNNRTLMVSTTNNLYEYDTNTDKFSLLNFDFGFSSEIINIFSLSNDKKGNLWLGTKDHGLFLWSRTDQETNRHQLHHVSQNNDLKYSTIYGIEQDQTENLWCSTQNGVVKLDPSGKLIKRFSIADGLQGMDFSFGASFQNRDGTIYFGGANGYNRFDPKQIDVENDPSPMRLTNISLPGRASSDIGDVSELQELELSHNDSSVTFQFSVLDFIDAERNQFRYKLENFESEWVENGTNNTASFTNLPAGEYTLRIQGANSSGIWNREGISLAITVLPAPWLTGWAYIIYVMAILGLVWALHRIYHSYAVERRSAEMAVEMFEAENRADDDMQEQLEMQDEWVNSAYQHYQTTLSLISGGISLAKLNRSEAVQQDLVETSIERIAALSRLEDCINYQAGGPCANLHAYTEGLLCELLNNTRVAPESIITINEVTSTPIDAELASPIAVILYELLNNCFQHAFEPDSPANYIHIVLAYGVTNVAPYRSLLLSVHDSGTGMPLDIENLDGQGSGIPIVKSIVEKLGGRLELSEASGTTISIEIPSP
ncbi:MAG: triple tyrosine motif-containing protein [Halioglobus sp.]